MKMIQEVTNSYTHWSNREITNPSITAQLHDQGASLLYWQLWIWMTSHMVFQLLQNMPSDHIKVIIKKDWSCIFHGHSQSYYWECSQWSISYICAYLLLPWLVGQIWAVHLGLCHWTLYLEVCSKTWLHRNGEMEIKWMTYLHFFAVRFVYSHILVVFKLANTANIVNIAELVQKKQAGWALYSTLWQSAPMTPSKLPCLGRAVQWIVNKMYTEVNLLSGALVWPQILTLTLHLTPINLGLLDTSLRYFNLWWCLSRDLTKVFWPG